MQRTADFGRVNLMNTTQTTTKLDTALAAAIAFETSRQIADLAESKVTHKWDVCGYTAPYRFVRYELSTFQAAPGLPIRAGSSCDICSTSIMHVYWIRDARGAEFKTGCDCVQHLGDVKLTSKIEKLARDMATTDKNAKADARIARAVALLDVDAVRAMLAATSHSYADRGTFFAKLSALNEATWLLERGGRSGKTRAARLIEAAAKSVGAK